VPVTVIENGDLEITLKQKHRLYVVPSYHGDSSSFAVSCAAPKMPDLCPTCLPKKIIAICNEALAAKSPKK